MSTWNASTPGTESPQPLPAPKPRHPEVPASWGFLPWLCRVGSADRASNSLGALWLAAVATCDWLWCTASEKQLRFCSGFQRSTLAGVPKLGGAAALLFGMARGQQGSESSSDVGSHAPEQVGNHLLKSETSATRWQQSQGQGCGSSSLTVICRRLALEAEGFRSSFLHPPHCQHQAMSPGVAGARTRMREKLQGPAVHE